LTRRKNDDMDQNNRIVIIGAGGHGRVAADIARRMGFQEIMFLDDGDTPCAVGKTEDFVRYLDNAVFFVAIGNGAVRRRLQTMLVTSGAKMTTLIHPNAVVAEDAQIGQGTVVMAGAVINPGAVVGSGTIINTCASVDHDCRIGDYVHVAVGARICGTVRIGDETWVGAGATVIQNMSICAGCMIGAGAVVVTPVTETGTYLGVPARKAK